MIDLQKHLTATTGGLYPPESPVEMQLLLFAENVFCSFLELNVGIGDL